MLHETTSLSLFTAALFAVILAFTRPLFFHLFRRGYRLYGSDRDDGMRRLGILFGAIFLSATGLWLLSLLLQVIPAYRPYTRLWILTTTWGGLSLCILGIVCILSWRVKQWLAIHSLSLRLFAAIALLVALVGAFTISRMAVLEHPIVLLLLCSYVGCGLCVRALSWPSYVPFDSPPLSAQLRNRSAKRVIVVVFDELDYRLLFERRPAWLAVPNIDAFIARSLSLQHAIPPSRCTEISIPALLIGQIVSETIAKGPNELDLQLAVGSPQIPFAQQRTMFHDALDHGYGVGCNVEYHPLHRIFPHLFAAVGWQQPPDTELGVKGNWVQSIWLQIRSVFETPAFSPFSDTLYGRHCVDRYHQCMASAISIVRDNTVDLAFLHFPIPHPPFIFDRHTNEVTARHASTRSYHDNLLLVDRTLANLMEAVRTSSTDRESVVILTSDHWYRHAAKQDFRVPFAVWLSATEPSVHTYAPRRNTIFLRKLISELLEGRLASAQEIVGWLDVSTCDHVPSKT